ncbi:MAG: prenyltransferase/squalene oxidase repeat-containing protein [Nannocystaceae bacterium]
MVLLDRVDDAIDRVSRHLAGRWTSRGQFLGGCEARALETGVFLHLLRLLRRDDEVQAGLARYCRRYLAQADDGELDATSPLHDLIATLVCRQVTRRDLSADELARLDTALAEFRHPTQWRKFALLHVLLCELGVLQAPELALRREVTQRSTHQLWVAIILTSLRILLAHQQGRIGEITEDEVRFIVDNQSADGSWEQHVLATLIALLALARAGRSSVALDRGIAYVRRQVRSDGGVPFIANEDVWVTCLSGLTLAEARPSTCDLNAVAHYVAGQQREDGGWAYAEGVRQTDADDTCVSLAFLARHDPIAYRGAIRRAQWYLVALQNADGGFPTFVRGAASEAEITAKAILALGASSSVGFASRATRAWSWLARAQQGDGSFRVEWKLCPTYPALHVLTAAAASSPEPTIARIRAGVCDYLLRTRQPGGGWGLGPADHEVHLLSTAYALAGLAVTDGMNRQELARSVSLLIEMQARDGSFRGRGDSLGPRPFVYDVPILASVYSLLALARTRRALLRQVPRTPAIARGGRRPRRVLDRLAVGGG